MLAVRHSNDFLNLLYVVLYVSHSYCWHGSCYIDKTVIHIIHFSLLTIDGMRSEESP